jgi:hypothetical protein
MLAGHVAMLLMSSSAEALTSAPTVTWLLVMVVKLWPWRGGVVEL